MTISRRARAAVPAAIIAAAAASTVWAPNASADIPTYTCSHVVDQGSHLTGFNCKDNSGTQLEATVVGPFEVVNSTSAESAPAYHCARGAIAGELGQLHGFACVPVG